MKEKFFIFFCAMIAEMDLAVVNLINVFFISRSLGDDGVAAYEIIFPCLLIVGGVIALVYNGVQAVCSKDYGSGDKEMFDRHKNAGYTWMLGIMILLSTLFMIFKRPLLELLGAYEEGTNIAGLCEECYMAYIPNFVFQGFFAVASCLLFLREKKILLAANLILYALMIGGNLWVLHFAPSMTGFIAVNAVSEAFAVVFIIIYWVAGRKSSLSACTAFRIFPKDITESLLTGLPDFMEYVFAAVLSLILNLYMIARFSSSMLAGYGIFESIENIPELLCVGFCFLSTATFGVRVGRVIQAYRPEERTKAERDLEQQSRSLTKAGIAVSVLAAILLLIMAKPVISQFGTEASEPEAADISFLLMVSYSIGFVFYMLNSELVSYYKVVKALWSAHSIFFAEAFAFPLLTSILLGELFGAVGFCFGGALAEILTFILNLCFIWKSCGHFPRCFKDFRMDKYIERNKKSRLTEGCK